MGYRRQDTGESGPGANNRLRIAVTDTGPGIPPEHMTSLFQPVNRLGAEHTGVDGTGYPKGLVGAAIPLAGRIVAAADVYDALTSVRPYKDPWPAEKAVSYMKHSAGTHFDPEVIDHFLEHLPDINEIMQEHADQ